MPHTARASLRGLAVAACAAVTLPLLAAAPASAQTATTTTTTSVSAATSASAIRLTINLPSALPINPIQLDVDPVAGTVRAVSGSAPEAQALATLLAGSIGGNAQSFPGARAMLPEPKESSAPTNAVSDGINGSPLGTGPNAFINVGAVTATASVTEAPSSASEAQIASLALGLPAPLAAALAQVLTPLLAGVEDLLERLGPIDEATLAVCTGLQPVTVPVQDGLEGVPVLGELLVEVVEGTLTPEQGVLCNLRAFLVELRDELAVALADLAGPGGLLETGLIGARQSITTEGTTVRAEATGSIADIALVGGVEPFGDVTALTTTSRAALAGGAPSADVEQTAVEAFAAPLLVIETDLRTVTGDLAGIEIDGLQALLDQVQTVLEGLAGIGIEAGPLDDAEPALASCPAELSSQLSGTIEQPSCAAAASRGFGLALTAPAQLAGPLGIETDENGEFLPLVALQIVPTAAVVRAEAQTTSTPGEFRGPLPRTGAEAPLAAAGVALLLGAAWLRRRRTV